tara:strand:+ start:949 stop:1650 length:702 start_codon:yes stop_codon:yes gene_type:complete
MKNRITDDFVMPQVVILAGGLGTRLGEITEHIPKSLIEISGKPIISHILDWVKLQGCKKVLVLTGHLGEMFEQFEYEGLSIDFHQEPEQLGTGGALSNAIDLLDELFILLWGDDLHPIDYNKLLQTHRQGSLLTMTVTQEHEIMNLIHHDGYVTEYDKTNENNNFNGYEAGTSIVSKKVVERFMKNGKWSWEQTVYPAMSGKIRAHIDNTKFWDMGTPERLKKLEDFLDSWTI